MVRRDFIKKSLIYASVAAVFMAVTNPVSAYASDGTIRKGAAGIASEAIETLQSGVLMEIGSSNEIEPIEERDLSGNFLKGIFVGPIDISGMTYQEAVSSVKKYVDSISASQITLNSIEGNYIEVPAKSFGIYWDDERTLADAISLGREGNIVEKYKAKKDLEHEKKVFPINIKADEDAITQIVAQQGELYNIEAKDATISKADGDFTITPGAKGEKIDVKASVSRIESEIREFDGNPKVIDLKVITDEPKGRTEDLEQIHDVIGAYKTSFSSSSSDRSGNVRNGTSLIDGVLMYPGDVFSVYDAVSPFTEENGYYLAGSYSNGMVVETFGGGICQVSSTLYNAVLRAELEVVERYNHSMIVTYVDLSSDAAISGTSKDFKFRNNKDFPIYIEGYTTSDKQVVFNIYGVENRPSNREVSFESVKISETVPDTERVVADPSSPLGSISVQSAHTGYVGELWKIVKVDGKEVERTQVNKSTYQPSPKTASVGTSTNNPAAQSIIQAAIATGSIDYCKSVIGELNAAAAAAAAAPLAIDPATGATQ